MAIAIRDDALASAGLPRADLDTLADLEPRFTSTENFEGDIVAASRFFQAGQALLERLPLRPKRSADEQVAADALIQYLRQVRIAFLRRHAAALYAQLTNERRDFVRVEDLVFLAAERVPGLVPARAQVL